MLNYMRGGRDVKIRHGRAAGKKMRALCYNSRVVPPVSDIFGAFARERRWRR